MQFTTVTPMLWTTDLKATLEFYTSVLGFSTDDFNGEWGWMHLQQGETTLMFCLPNSHEPFDKPLCTGSFYFGVTDVDALWNKLKNHPNIYYGIETFDYGMREFAIKDNNGYILQFGTQVKND